jgi:hypothetical protein
MEIVLMKTGKTLVEMAQELQRQSEAKRDFIADTRTVEMTPDGQLVLENGTRHEFPVSDHAHSQIAARLDIPAKYYNRMRQEDPELLAINTNNWCAIRLV